MKLNDFLIEPEASIVEALRRLDATAKHTLLVVDPQRRLLGTLTDGDVRRAILESGTLGISVSAAFNGNPHVLGIERRDEALRLLSQLGLDAIPLVSDDNEVVDCVFRDGFIPEREDRSGIDLPVVMMAGGLGTRLYPYTKVLPKPLIPINDVPIAERIINSFHLQGCQRFILIVNHKKEMIKAYFSEIERDYSIEFVDEKEFLGTGGGLSLVRDMVPETFVLTNCDILIDADFAKVLQLHKMRSNAVTMVVSLKNYAIPYGTVEIDAGGDISAMVEKPSIPYLVNTGCYIVEKYVLDFIEKGENLGFPDVIERCQAAGERVGVYPVSEQSWLDMGQLDEMIHMSSLLNEKK